MGARRETGQRRTWLAPLFFLAASVGVLAMGTLIPSPKAHATQAPKCGEKEYDPKTQGCCDGKTTFVVYDLKTQGCCKDAVYTKATQGCCNNEKIYDTKTQMCCKDKVVDLPPWQ